MTRTIGRPIAAMLCLCLAPITSADDARDVIDRAVRARAGTTIRLEKMGCMVEKRQGVLVSGGARIPATWESWAVLPDQFKFRIGMNIGGDIRPVEMILDEPRAWRHTAASGEVLTLSSTEMRELGDEAYAHWVATLIPARKDGVELKSIAGEKVNDAETVGVRASKRGRPDVDLYFDRKTNHLVQVVFKAKEATIPVTKKWVYSKHREFDRLTLPAEIDISYDGRPIAKWQVTGYEFPERLEGGVFAKPE